MILFRWTLIGDSRARCRHVRVRKPIPTLAEYIENRFTPWARATFEQASPKTWTGWYRTQLANISSYKPLVNRKLDRITSEHAADYAAGAQQAGIAARTFADVEAAALALRESLAPGVVVLLKASRGARLERVLSGLEAEGG